MNQLGTGSISANGTTNPSSPATANLTGLTPSTNYWWTACFDNAAEAGIEDCGQVKTFTAADPDPETCEANPNLPGCEEPDPCIANPSLRQCQPDPTCETDPTLPECQTKKAKVGVSKPKAAKVKRGKSVTLVTTVKNTGNAAATGVKVCATVAKKFESRLKVPACVKPGTVNAGASVKVKLKVKAAKKAKKGKVPVKVAFSGSGGSGSVTASVTIK